MKADDPSREEASASEPRASGVRGWLGVARNLVARVVDKGLHLPEAAQLFRGTPRPRVPKPPPPLPTVTLAEIYAAQGHAQKALQVLDQVLEREPDHAEARALRSKLAPRDPEPPPAPAADTPPAPAPPPAAAAALPTHYDVDELVAVPTDPHTAYVYWEIRPLRYARARARQPDGRLVLRALSVTPSGHATEAHCRDLPIDELVGDRFVGDLAPGCELRLCLGWVGPQGFVPLVVGTDLRIPKADEPALPTGGIAPASAMRALRAYAEQASREGTPSFGALLSRYERGELEEGELEEIRRFFGQAGGASELSGR